jgi:protein-tyrosine phosphatase
MANGIRGMRDLQGAWNFRDVADSTGVLRPGRLFRSGELSGLDDDGRSELRRLGITDVADLRSPREVERRGSGRVPDGVDIHLLPIPDLAVDETGPAKSGRPRSEAPHEHAFRQLMADKPGDESVNEASTRYMIDEYRRFPTYSGARRALHRVVTLLGGGRAVLTHCFAGKDRTGFMVALVLEAVGVDRAAILADFLRSNEAAPQLRARILEMLEQRSDTELTPEVMTFTEARLSDNILGVRAEYLGAARQAVDENFGSLNGYLRSAEITEADVDRLRAALLG